MERVEIGSVAVFRDLEASKAQALKPLEEAAEVFGAWQAWRENGPTLDKPRPVSWIESLTSAATPYRRA